MTQQCFAIQFNGWCVVDEQKYSSHRTSSYKIKSTICIDIDSNLDSFPLGVGISLWSSSVAPGYCSFQLTAVSSTSCLDCKHHIKPSLGNRPFSTTNWHPVFGVAITVYIVSQCHQSPCDLPYLRVFQTSWQLCPWVSQFSRRHWINMSFHQMQKSHLHYEPYLHLATTLWNWMVESMCVIDGMASTRVWIAGHLMLQAFQMACVKVLHIPGTVPVWSPVHVSYIMHPLKPIQENVYRRLQYAHHETLMMWLVQKQGPQLDHQNFMILR